MPRYGKETETFVTAVQSGAIHARLGEWPDELEWRRAQSRMITGLLEQEPKPRIFEADLFRAVTAELDAGSPFQNPRTYYVMRHAEDCLRRTMTGLPSVKLASYEGGRFAAYGTMIVKGQPVVLFDDGIIMFASRWAASMAELFKYGCLPKVIDAGRSGDWTMTSEEVSENLNAGVDGRKACWNLVAKLVHYTFDPLGEWHKLSPEDAEPMTELGEMVQQAMIYWVLAHEFGHVLHGDLASPGSPGDYPIDFMSQLSVSHSQAGELAADATATMLCVTAMVKAGVEPAMAITAVNLAVLAHALVEAAIDACGPDSADRSGGSHTHPPFTMRRRVVSGMIVRLDEMLYNTAGALCHYADSMLEALFNVLYPFVMDFFRWAEAEFAAGYRADEIARRYANRRGEESPW